MDFGNGKFEILIENNGKIVYNMGEMALQVGDLLGGGER